MNTHKDITAFLPTLKEDLNADIPSYYQAIAAFYIAKCNTGIISELDTTWHYIRLAFEKFEKNRMFTPAFQECIELLTIDCTYNRQNFLAIRYANVLFEFDRFCEKLFRCMSRFAYGRLYIFFYFIGLPATCFCINYQNFT